MGGWTEERVKQLRQMWLAGASCSQIAAAIGAGFSRNAVIGKVHRLGLQGRSKDASGQAITAARHGVARKPGRPRQPAPIVPRAPKGPKLPPVPMSSPLSRSLSRTLPAYDEAAALERRLTIWQLEHDQCRWAVGEIELEERQVMIFCGDAKEHAETPYCRYHRLVGTQTPAERKRERNKLQDAQDAVRGGQRAPMRRLKDYVL